MAIKKKEEAKQPVVEVSKLQQWFDKNKKTISWIGTIAILAVVGVFAYISFYSRPRNEAARDAVAAAMTLLGEAPDSTSYATALSGDGVTKGLEAVISEYGSRAASAYLYAAVCEMNLGNFEKAKAYLDDYSTDDPIFKARAIAAKADCDVELGNTEAAAKAYLKAAEASDDIIAARYLFKAGLAFEELGQNDKAVEAYKKIKSRYADSFEAQNIDIYISKLETE